MNGNEKDILNKMWDDVKEIKEKTAETSERAAVNATNLKQMERWTGNIHKKLESWESGGCPHGKVLDERISGMDREIAEAKDIATGTPSKKQSAGFAAGAAVIVTAIIQGILAAFKGQ